MGNLGTDLSNEHPIGLLYAADTALNATTTTFTGGNSDSIAEVLFGGNVECASCHDVHGQGESSLLRDSMSGSSLCLTCHNK